MQILDTDGWVPYLEMLRILLIFHGNKFFFCVWIAKMGWKPKTLDTSHSVRLHQDCMRWYRWIVGMWFRNRSDTSWDDCITLHQSWLQLTDPQNATGELCERQLHNGAHWAHLKTAPWFVLVYFTVSFLLFCLFISTMKIELGSKLCELFLSNLQNLPLSACNNWILLWISIVWLLLWNCDPKSWISSVISEVQEEGIGVSIFLNLQRKIWLVSYSIWLLQLRNYKMFPFIVYIWYIDNTPPKYINSVSLSS